jgi:hypothetical protein
MPDRLTRTDRVLLFVYSVLIFVQALFHEMWRDEVRAWTVATGAKSWVAMIAELHHEGHPAVWYIVLRSGFMLTHSRLVLPVAAAIFAIGASWLIMRFSPLPQWLNSLAIFGAFLGSEFSVSARNYGIGVLFMILACVAYPRRGKRTLGFAVALVLLANTSIHGAIAGVIILALWLTDSGARREAGSRQMMQLVGIVAIGTAVSLVTARPSPEMVWAAPLASLNAAKVLASVLMDPGKALTGFMGANIAATSEYPWALISVDPLLAGRLIVDGCLLWIVWNMRASWRGVVALLVTVLTFEVVFRSIYTGSLRHEGLVFFLIFAIGWIVSLSENIDSRQMRRRIGIGFAPLLVLQALALPIVAIRTIRHQESSSRLYGQFIGKQLKYQNAILLGEPDYFMESMPYYVANRIYMPRQQGFSDRAYFDNGLHRRRVMTLSRLQETAIDLTCRFRAPVLVAIQTHGISARRAGSFPVAYHGTFTWTAAEDARFHALFQRVAVFPRATTDEVYEVFEAPACRQASSVSP